MSTNPTRPEEKTEPETEKTVRERDATFDRDKKTAETWPKAKARILDQLKQLNKH